MTPQPVRIALQSPRSKLCAANTRQLCTRRKRCSVHDCRCTTAGADALQKQTGHPEKDWPSRNRLAIVALEMMRLGMHLLALEMMRLGMHLLASHWVLVVGTRMADLRNCW